MSAEVALSQSQSKVLTAYHDLPFVETSEFRPKLDSWGCSVIKLLEEVNGGNLWPRNVVNGTEVAWGLEDRKQGEYVIDFHTVPKNRPQDSNLLIINIYDYCGLENGNSKTSIGMVTFRVDKDVYTTVTQDDGRYGLVSIIGIVTDTVMSLVEV